MNNILINNYVAYKWLLSSGTTCKQWQFYEEARRGWSPPKLSLPHLLAYLELDHRHATRKG